MRHVFLLKRLFLVVLFFVEPACNSSPSLSDVFNMRRDDWCEAHAPSDLCPKCMGGKKLNWVNEDTYKLANSLGELLYLIPVYPPGECCRFNERGVEGHNTLLSKCRLCNNRPVAYSGYLYRHFSRYFYLFRDFLSYVDSNKVCSCYWPELSKKALDINNKAAELLKNLCFEMFPLYGNAKYSDQLFPKVRNYYYTGDPDTWFECTWYGTPIVCMVCHTLLFSDYDWVLRDLEFLLKQHITDGDYTYVKNELRKIRNELGWDFYEIYKECLQNHPSERIQNEMLILEAFLGIPSEGDKEGFLFGGGFREKGATEIECCARGARVSEDINPRLWSDKTCDVYQDRPDHWLQSEVLLQRGTVLNDLFLYGDAIESLSDSINLNPNNVTAYLERAAAYFEKGEYELAILDYQEYKIRSGVPPLLKVAPPKSSIRSALPLTSIGLNNEFPKGLVLGVVTGSAVGIEEVVPSVFGCCRGLVKGLWAFCCSPVEISGELLVTAKEIGNWVAAHYPHEWLEAVVPEIRELRLTWYDISEFQRGEKIGYIIGKYGIDIFITAGVVKGFTTYRALKRANTAMTLEACITSQSKKATILERSVEHFKVSSKSSGITKKGTILVKNSNAKYHIMQKKHAWERLVKITDDVDKDFRQVVKLLEKSDIKECAHTVRGPFGFPKENPKVQKMNYEININGHEVYASFEEYIQTGQIYLQDAWVITR